ncbi:hypothetical protein D9757_011428 [Collybiopsis confluens]|uniref:Uncharacterized protein n=1 Tax=Collybiopsis confluens TaxID=2823264 RepID=A0A8H5GHT7_9AGAR|nr:hypothetical protein D9757_011428 [Collybiopsis confluens]
MPTTLTTISTEEEDRWSNLSSTDQWQLSFEAVSWAHDSPDSRKTRCKALFRLLNGGSVGSDQADVDSTSSAIELELNSDHVGCRAAFDVLNLYEKNSGFQYKFAGLDLSKEHAPDLSRHIDARNVAVSKESWDELVQDLTGDFTEGYVDASSSDSDSSSLASSLVFDWEFRSHVSIPTTPKPPPTSSLSVNITPWSSPLSKLNASASTFTPAGISVPSFASFTKKPYSPAPPLHEFEFPSLNPPSKSSPSFYPKLRIENDDQGFATNIEAEAEELTPRSRIQPLNSLLPAFIHQDEDTRRKGSPSKTRSLVDRLRSRRPSSRGRDGSGYRPSPSPVDPRLHQRQSSAESSDDESDRSRSSSVPRYSASSSTDYDGWVSFDDHVSPSSSYSQKRRHVGLSLSSPKPRTADSRQEAMELEEGDLSSPSSQGASLSASSSSSSLPSTPSTPPTPATPIITTADGWVEVSEAPSKPKRKSSTGPSKKPVHAEADVITFPTLNGPPPSQPSRRSSRTRHARSSSGASSKAKANTFKVVPVNSSPTYFPAYPPPGVPVPMSFGVGTSYLTPMMPPFVAPGMAMSPQYSQFPPSVYHQPRQPQPHQQYLNQPQRAHNVTVPVSLSSVPAYGHPYLSQLAMLQGWR